MTHVLIYRVALISIMFFFSEDLYSNENYQNFNQKKIEKILIKAQKAIENDNYIEAEKLVLEAICLDSSKIKSFLLLSDISDELQKPEQKKRALFKVIDLDSTNFPLAYKLLATLSFESGDYRNSLENYDHYNQFRIKKDTLLIDERINSCQFAIHSLLEDKKVEITHIGMNVNSPSQEYWPAISTNDSLLYFTRLIEKKGQYPYERIFISQKGEADWGESFKMNFSDNEDVNLGTINLSVDGKLLFFTACGRTDGFGSCDVYYAHKINNFWSKPIKNSGRMEE